MPEPVQRVLRRATAFDPKRRYRNAIELHRALEAAFSRAEAEKEKRRAPRRRPRPPAQTPSPLAVQAEAFRQRHGATDDEVRYVLTHKRVNASKSDGAKQDTPWTPKSISYVREKERMIFRILASRGFFYDPPQASVD